jgi:hypothetical protein
MAPAEASWAALMGLYTAGLRDGAPPPLLAASGGASISTECEAVCARWELAHQTMVSPHGERSMHWMATPCNMQRRLSDSQFSLRHTPAELAQVHQVCIQTYNTTAHQGLLTCQLDTFFVLEGHGL